MRAATLLVAALALSACARLGIDPPAMPSVAAATAESESGDETSEPAADETAEAPEGGSGEDDAAAEAPEAEAAAETAAEAPSEAVPGAAAASAAAAAEAPHVYMALQPDRAGPVSVVFAIDRSRDGTPSDEPAIRLTPEETEAGSGRCNPQQMRYYKFSGESAARPVYGPDEAARGISAREMPEFMATAVSAEMMERGIAAELEDTRPQNVCTRKLFQQTIIAASTGQG